MRYRGQRHNIKVPVSGLKDAEQIRAAFERDYKRRYGHADAKAPAEFQALHLSAFARLKQPEIARLPRAAGKIPAGAETQNLYRKRGRLGGRADLSSRCVGAGLQRHRAGGDRRIRIDDGGVAGRSFRDRRAAGD